MKFINQLSTSEVADLLVKSGFIQLKESGYIENIDLVPESNQTLKRAYCWEIEDPCFISDCEVFLNGQTIELGVRVLNPIEGTGRMLQKDNTCIINDYYVVPHNKSLDIKEHEKCIHRYRRILYERFGEEYAKAFLLGEDQEI